MPSYVVTNYETNIYVANTARRFGHAVNRNETRGGGGGGRMQASTPDYLQQEGKIAIANKESPFRETVPVDVAAFKETQPGALCSYATWRARREPSFTLRTKRRNSAKERARQSLYIGIDRFSFMHQTPRHDRNIFGWIVITTKLFVESSGMTYIV